MASYQEILRSLYPEDAPISPAAIAAKLNTKVNLINTSLMRLVERGWLQKEGDGLSLTELGRRQFEHPEIPITSIPVDVRLASWLCVAIEDTITRFQYVLKDQREWLASEEQSAHEARERQKAPILGQFANPEYYEEQIGRLRGEIARDEAAINELLQLLKMASQLSDKITMFWLHRERHGNGN